MSGPWSPVSPPAGQNFVEEVAFDEYGFDGPTFVIFFTEDMDLTDPASLLAGFAVLVNGSPVAILSAFWDGYDVLKLTTAPVPPMESWSFTYNGSSGLLRSGNLIPQTDFSWSYPV